MPRKYQQFYLPISLLLLLIIYAIRIGANDVWYPNESFYADSLRNWMEGRGNWFEFWYNDARRFNKPPGTYFYIYVSALIFGLNEFALRISMALLAVGSVFYTFKIGDFLFGEKAGWLSGAIMAVSLQFIANVRYATPEIPLCFAFAATMYYFIKGIRTGKSSTIWLAWIFLGITVLTKGFPYYVVIGGTVFLYFLWSHKRIGPTLKALWKIKIIPGALLSLLIGMSWPIYSYFVEKDGFLGMYGAETLGRASNFQEYTYSLIKQLKYYPEAMTWAFLPYSIAMFLALFILIKRRDFNDGIRFLFSWVIIMYVIFTLSSGKLPTYFIQAHPALSAITAYAILKYKDFFTGTFLKALCFYLPTFLGIAIAYITLFLYKAPFYLYFIPPFFIVVFYFIIKENYSRLYFAPFASMIPFIFIFFSFILPKMETFRPFDIIGATLKKTDIPMDVPMYSHKHRMHNLPYYTGRKSYTDLEDEDVLEVIRHKRPAILIVRDSMLSQLPPVEVLWKGPLFYAKTEGKFFQYFKANQKALNGNMEDFVDYSILYFDEQK